MDTKIYSTNDVPQKMKLAYWDEAICRSFTKLSCDIPKSAAVHSENFNASIESCNYDKVQLAKVTSTSSLVSRSKRQANHATSEVLLVHLQTKGSSYNIQGEKEVHLKPGDWTICNNLMPYSVEIKDYHEMLVARIPANFLKNHSTSNNYSNGQILDTNSPFCGVIRQYLLSLWGIKNATLNENEVYTLTDNLISMIDTSVNPDIPTESAVHLTHMQNIYLYIRNNLRSPGLSPRRVALANGISDRYLRSLFEQSNLSCSNYILKQRLHHVSQDLKDPRLNGKTISEIAFYWGFNSSSYFSRVFRTHLNTSPREYRNSVKDEPAYPE